MARLFYFALCVVLLSACKDSRVEGLQAQVDTLQRDLSNRAGQLDDALERLKVAEQHSVFSTPVFTVANEVIAIEERSFEPSISGQFTVLAEGDVLPEVIFVELQISTVVKKNNQEYTQNIIHRIMPGAEQKNLIEFVHPLSQHGVKSTGVSLQVTPVSWYQGYPVK